MRLKNILIVVQDVDKSKEYYHSLFGLDAITSVEGKIILTEGLVLQEEKYWKECINNESSSHNNHFELYFEESDVERFVARVEEYYPDTIFVNRLEENGCGKKIVRLYDLDGNLIEVGTPS